MFKRSLGAGYLDVFPSGGQKTSLYKSLLTLSRGEQRENSNSLFFVFAKKRVSFSLPHFTSFKTMASKRSLPLLFCFALLIPFTSSEKESLGGKKKVFAPKSSFDTRATRRLGPDPKRVSRQRSSLGLRYRGPASS